MTLRHGCFRSLLRMSEGAAGAGEGACSAAGLERLWLRTLAPGPARWLAWPILALVAVLFHAARECKFRIFRWGLFPRTRLAAFTVSVGNVAVGGTGKTPATLAIGRLLSELPGTRVAVLSRGYRSRNREWVRRISADGSLAADAALGGDEAYLLAASLPRASVYVGKRRALTGRAAEADGHTAVVLDDGLQYWRLERDLDVVCFSALWPLAAYRPFPLGILREPLGRIRDVQFALISGANQVPEEQVRQLEGLIRAEAPGIGIARIELELVGASKPGERALLAGRGELAGKRVLAVSNIVNPARFWSSIEHDLGATVVGLAFPDHHCHGPGDVARMFERAVAERAHAILATEKDEQSILELGLPHTTVPIWIARGQARLTGKDAGALEEALCEGLAARAAGGADVR
ncbi:MAG: tetraacyldisaccharide 4'-kinase [Candidatus Wallbacteria bacterium]|nr:tetraacyldisaccharide 4'-kinase [Candidatus Wallbacteria bacterium]